MTWKYQITALITLSLVSLSVSASANPVIVPRELNAWELLVARTVPPVLLIAEGMIIALLAKSSQVYSIRFVAVWFVITLLTWILFLASLDRLLPRPLYPHLTDTMMFGGEVIVTIIEAGAIWIMLRLPFFARATDNPPSPTRALCYSAVANAVSFGVALALAMPYWLLCNMPF